MFKRLTPQQREVYAALRALREMIVTPNDARPLHALKRRGLVRFRRDDLGCKIAVLKLNARDQRAEQRDERLLKRVRQWALTRADAHELTK